jgi:hypothetical protein
MGLQILSSSTCGRQFDDENCATLFTIVATDFAAVLLNDSVAHA